MTEEPPKDEPQKQFDLELLVKITNKKSGKITFISLSKDPWQVYGAVLTPLLIKAFGNMVRTYSPKEPEVKKESETNGNGN